LAFKRDPTQAKAHFLGFNIANGESLSAPCTLSRISPINIKAILDEKMASILKIPDP